jgi:hypothetical protein
VIREHNLGREIAGLWEEIVDRRFGTVVAVEGPAGGWGHPGKDFEVLVGPVAERVAQDSLTIRIDYSADRMYLAERSYLPRLEIEQNPPPKYTVAGLVRRPEQCPLETPVGNSNHIHHQLVGTPPPEDSHWDWEGIPFAADSAADTTQPVSADQAAKSEQKTLAEWYW